MASDAGMAYWGFVWYITHNPFKPVNGMTIEDIDKMADLYYASNATIINQAKPYTSIYETNTAAAFTNADFPDKDGGDGTGIAATTAPAAINQAVFPETHKGS